MLMCLFMQQSKHRQLWLRNGARLRP
uniref:Uncharacterized protein n=1 Tax=Arundo donax TaxID=35708 RepID=A0A0A9FZQ9_ARUDO